jgi:hypothetical protein
LETDVFHREFELAFDLIANCLADADAIWTSQRLQSCCNIDTIAKNLFAIDYDISHINADAELHFLHFGHGGIAFPHRALKLDRTAQGVDHAGKHHQHPVAHDPNDATVMFSCLGFDNRAPVALPLGERAVLIRLDESTVPSDIGCQNGGEPSLYAFAGQAALRIGRR